MARDQNGDRFERIIGQGLAAGRSDGDAHCLEPSIIAAYSERSLSRDQRAQCDRHFAQCARCAGALAALARIDATLDPAEGGGAYRAQATRSPGRARWPVRAPLPARRPSPLPLSRSSSSSNSKRSSRRSLPLPARPNRNFQVKAFARSITPPAPAIPSIGAAPLTEGRTLQASTIPSSR